MSLTTDGQIFKDGTPVIFAHLLAHVITNYPDGPYPRTRIQYFATGNRETVPSDSLSEFRDAKICQAAAEALYAAATSDNHEIASSDAGIYRTLERAFIASVRTVYGLSDLKARRVRDMLAELGPHDGGAGTAGWGIASYVEYVMTHRTSSAYER